MAAAALLLLAAAAAPAPAVHTRDVLAARGLVWAGRTDGLAVLDLEDPPRPKSVARLSVKSPVLGLAAEGERVALAAGHLGCVLVDAADPKKPRVLGTWNETEKVVDVALAGDVIFLAEDGAGWRAVDFRDPARPRSLASVATRGRVRRLALQGNRLATAEKDGGVRIFDVSVPTAPREVRALALEDVQAVAWAGDRLLVALGSGGLGVLDPAPDGGSRLAARLPGPAFELAVLGTLAAASDGGTGVRLYDVSDPAQPRARASVTLPRELPAGALSLAGTRLYVAADTASVAVLDVSDPEAPAALAPAERKLKVSFPK
ncbi:MAG TPA: hypothetical protein VFV75_08625 [Candidatus Polarisedimenticolaceae bacterium]|nr:hypothetical protein [Candidatus Polarisedimenticolaceae bacterium]